MAKTVAEKLLIKPNTTLWTSRPAGLDVIAPLPAGVSQAGGPEGAQTALIFADDEASLRQVLAQHKDHLASPTVLWVAYPKGNRTNINRDTLWPIVGEYGLRPIGQVALDDVWSALRFRPLAKGEPAFTGGKTA